MREKIQQYIVGIDEAGRGPLAGPVAVGVVCVPEGFDWEAELPGVGDSKAVSEVKRGAIFAQAKKLRRGRAINFAVAIVSASVIDRKGIRFAIDTAMGRAIARLRLDPQNVFINLDGSLSAPLQFDQATHIKGDALFKEIGLASICAKETRDAHMRILHKKHPIYGLDQHKGYGTKSHREAIAQHGLSQIHRATYCKNIKLL